MYLQRTIRQRVSVHGIGLHKGQPASLSFRPAPPGTGIHVVRVDLPGSPSIPVRAENIQATSLATTLGGKHFSVSTVEHCLSALAAFRIDNLFIELSGPEIPIGDGSAKVFLEALLKAGFAEQEEPRRYLYIAEPIFYGEGDKHAYVVPYSGLRVTCTIDFPNACIGRSRMDLDISETSFIREIGPARTFGFLKDVEAMRAKGLALGGSLDNAIVVGDQGVMNPGGLRFEDEFVRHKVLDALGDLVTLGRPLLGQVVLFKAGHDIMSKLVKKILACPERTKSISLGGPWQSELASSVAGLRESFDPR